MELLFWGHGPSDKNEKIQLHKHTFIQIEIILNGIRRCWNSEDDILLKAGEAVLVPVNVEHSFTNQSDDLEYLSFKIRIDEESTFSHRIFKIFRDPFVDWIIKDFRELAHNKRYNSSPVYTELMHALLGALLTHLNQSNSCVPENTMLLTIRKCIIKYGAKCNVGVLADELNMNIYKLRREFKRIMRELPAGGIRYSSPQMLIKSELLAVAFKHLRESNVKVGAISDMLHFNNLYTFSRFIKNNTGLSPNNYRKKYSKLQEI